MSTAVKGLVAYSHVNICVTDVEAADDFYVGKLGLEKLPRPDLGEFAGSWLRMGPSQLHLSKVDKMPDTAGAMSHFALYIPADEFDATMAELAERGLEFVSEPNQREDFGVPVKTAFARDPDGNLIEFTDVALFE
ncbi:MAG: lactoylglutathione lyase [Acidimicrobiia bacterium]|nr:lactoylglutathione lyase [Acidimicrobiia bacterium]MYG58958.1 lactoylglutathione lyase [Acidimicrobiia bacterium]MYJ32148.1 lactoylglutathione lyase [Acidimicrobiia bacterium]MYJ33139.1 lactoylglutathione lyase [Acidimicrobiia bacterium]